MKIVVGLPSRGRPLDLIASVISLYRTCGPDNEVCVMLALDNDDAESVAVGRRLATGYQFPHFAVELDICDRAPALGERHNRVIAAMPTEAIYLMWSDRMNMLGLTWDHQIAVGCLQFPNRPLWIDSVHLVGAGQIIMPPAWRAVQGGPCFPALSPFWFDDTAQEELDLFVHGIPRMRIEALCAGPRGAKTNRSRDIEFWVDVFAATRPQRVERAREICRKLGLPFANPAAMLVAREAIDADMKRRAPELQAQWGDQGEPDETYLAAKAAAMRLMHDAGIGEPWHTPAKLHFPNPASAVV